MGYEWLVLLWRPRTARAMCGWLIKEAERYSKNVEQRRLAARAMNKLERAKGT
jgi:hypothetical protein